MASVKVQLNLHKKNKAGEHPIIIQVIHNRRKKIIYLKEYLKVEEWDDNSSTAIEKSKSKERLLFLRKLNISIDQKVNNLKRQIIELEERNQAYTVDQIIDSIKSKAVSLTIFTFTENIISRLENTGKKGNSIAYTSFLSVFKKYRNEKDLTFDELNYKMLVNFEEYLQAKKRTVNAISFHMRTLRSVYNKAIKEGIANQELYPFKDYRIKREKTSKRAIIKGDISAIKDLDLAEQPELEKARDYFMFGFYTRGMAFVDMAYLKVKNISGDRLVYSRSKTNQKFSIKLTPPCYSIIRKYNDLKNIESFLFPIIIDPKGDQYTQYRNAMRLTNKKLKKIGEMIGLSIPLTTYVSRHSWATIAKRSGISTAIISEGLGHETERTTQIYLDSFENQVLDDANEIITNI